MLAVRWLFFVVFALIGAIGILWGLRRRDRMFSFPFLISAATTGFITPQIYTVVDREALVPDDAYCLTLFHGINCMLLAYAGYFSYQTPKTTPKYTYDSFRILMVGFFVILVGLTGYILLDVFVYHGFLNGYTQESGLYTIEKRGLPVYCLTIAQFVTPGILLVSTSIWLRPRWLALPILLVGLFYPLLDVAILGRRFMLIMLMSAFIFPVHFIRRFTPSWITLGIAGIFIMLAVIIFPEYRQRAGLDVGLKGIMEINVMEEIEKYMSGDKRRLNLEFPYHMLSIGAIYQTGGYGYGVDFYNALVLQYVPRGIVGRETKEKFTLPGAQPEEAQRTVYGTHGMTMLAKQGVIDSFWEFGFAGAIMFFILGRFWRWLYDRGMRDRDPDAIMSLIFFSWVPPFVIYGGFLATFNRAIMVGVFFMLLRYFSRMPIQSRVAKKAVTASRARVRPRPSFASTAPARA